MSATEGRDKLVFYVNGIEVNVMFNFEAHTTGLRYTVKKFTIPHFISQAVAEWLKVSYHAKLFRGLSSYIVSCNTAVIILAECVVLCRLYASAL